MDVFVGLKKEVQEIKEHLVYGSSRDVVSIVGMGGIGKTTLTKKVYDDNVVVNHFHVRAWCAISQVYQTRALLLDILRDVAGSIDNVIRMSEEDLAAELYRSLKGRRYLIVIDDIWDIDAWNGLKRSFPDDNNGSRIIITSRIIDVGSEVKLGAKTYPLHLGPFENDESWELLQKKIFSHQCCPPELVVVGQKIANLCGGLPLAIVVIAGVLAGLGKQQNVWEKVAENVSDHLTKKRKRNIGDHISNDPSQCMNILELSFKHLPDHLKSCFLYFGAFPEDRKIPALKLKRLWIGEGFIQGDVKDNLEDIAESYLNDLIDRSLIIASKTRSKWRVKTLSIHDLLRDLCLEKAEEANFFQVIGLHHNSLSTQHRLIFHSHLDFDVWKTRSQHVSSVICFYENVDCFRENVHEISFSDITDRTKLLKVLDLGGSKASSPGLEFQVHLRYLVVGSINIGIPLSIGKLLNLQFFCVDFDDSDYELPDSFWKLERLICVQIESKVRFAPLKDAPGSSCQLLRLQSFSRLYVYGDHAEKTLRRLPNLKKLSCMLGQSWDSYMKYNWVPALDFLSKLQSLELSCEGGVGRYPWQLSFPLNIKKLKLSNFHLPWNEISQIARLPNLEVLKLESKAFVGEQWDLEEGDFSKLRYLKLFKIWFRRWSVTGDDFPCLERLVLEQCYDLEEIPASFGDISTLGKIEISWCSHSVLLSSRVIQGDKLEMGNEMFTVDFNQEFQPLEGDSVTKFTGHKYDGPYIFSRSAVACSPTDATLVATSGFYSIFLWRIGEQDSTGSQLLAFGAQLEVAESLAFSADGLLLVSAGSWCILVWDISSRDLKCKLEGLKHIECVRWHPNRHIVSAAGESASSSNSIVLMWDADTGAPLATFSGHNGRVTCTALTPDGKMMCTGSHAGSMRIWDLETHESIHDVKGPSSLESMEISPDSALALCGTWDGDVYLVNITNGKVVTSPTTHAEVVICVGFAVSSPWAATGGLDGKIIIWNLEPFEPRCICEYEAGMKALSWLGGSRYLATGPKDGMVHIWDAISGECVTTFSDHKKAVDGFNPVISLSVSINGDFLVSGAYDGMPCVFDIKQFKERQ